MFVSVNVDEREGGWSPAVRDGVVQFHSGYGGFTELVPRWTANVPTDPIAVLFGSLAISRVQHNSERSHSALPIPSHTPLECIKLYVVLPSHAHRATIYSTCEGVTPFLRSFEETRTHLGGSIFSKLRQPEFTILSAHNPWTTKDGMDVHEEVRTKGKDGRAHPGWRLEGCGTSEWIAHAATETKGVPIAWPVCRATCQHNLRRFVP